MAYEPQKSDKFTFGLWTMGNPGRDPFGDPVRKGFTPVEMAEALGKLGAYGINYHDNDLVPFGASAAEQDRIVAEFKKALSDNGLVVPMATTNLFGHPVFKDGAFTSNDSRVRAFALQKVMRSMDLGYELGARIYVFWGGREGAEVDAGKDAVTACARMRDGLNFLCEYSKSQGYEYKFALEAKPNEPRGDIYLPTTGAMLGFIATLQYSEMVGVNPEVAHETISGLNFYHAVAQAIDAGKLFHVDLNGQKVGRFDQDLRFGQEDSKNAFFLVRLLENYKFDGMRHFDAHALRTSDRDDVIEFAKGCMRTYLILKEKAQQFDADPVVQEILAGLNTSGDPASDTLLDGGFTAEKATALKARTFDADALAAKPLPYEKLDQRLFDILMGVA
ncbi:MAG: xylose isomerase [Fibrella sp.]|nr:xylose isomerase [Armatimonadota bacterium]